MPSFLATAASYVLAIDPLEVASEASRHVLGFVQAIKDHPDLWTAYEPHVRLLKADAAPLFGDVRGH